MRVKFNIYQHQPDLDIEILEAALRKNRNLKALVGLGLILIGIVIILTSLQGLPEKTAFLVAVCCMLLSFTGFYFLLSALLRYDTHKNYLLQLITRCPDELVWIYYQKIESLPFGIRFLQFTSLHIYLLNREHIAIPMSEKNIHLLLPHLKARLPKATFGYTKSNEQLYNIAPDLLTK